MSDLPRTSVVKTNLVSFSGLLADKYCGERTKLIYYLNAGELLSRAFNFKDTYSPRGELLVVYTDKTQPTAAVLGFSSPSFGSDIIFPPEINTQLRQAILQGHGSKAEQGELDDDEYSLQLLRDFSNISVSQVRAFTGTACYYA